MPNKTILLIILSGIFLFACQNSKEEKQSEEFETITTPTGKWQLVWNEEFDYTGLPDSAKWSYDTEGNSWGWGNNEAQHYTVGDSSKAYVNDGMLTITAKIDSMGGKKYTSARLITKERVTGCTDGSK